MKSTVFFLIFAIGWYSSNADLLDAGKKFLTSVKNNIVSSNSIVKDSVDTAFIFDKPPERVPVPEIIKSVGYESESHYATTDDGYILNIHRIPHGNSNKKKKSTPVYLQHGLLCSSADWVLLGPNKSLAYILADEGYDVWMGNVRGNHYSRNHTTLNPNKTEFWQFSWNEIGTHDIPTMVDYILSITGKSQLFHIGHSQGTTSFYVMTSERPEYNKKIKAHISLAPVAFMNNMVSPLVRLLAYGNLPFGQTQFSLIGDKEFMPSNSFLVSFNNAACSIGVGAVYCKISIFALAGFSPNQMDAKDTALIYAHYPAGSSVKQILHYCQEVVSGHFRKYDFGKVKNLKVYSNEAPPDYDLFKISAPIYLIYSSNDWLANDIDVERLYQKLKSVREKYWVPIPTWNHMDYLFGKDAPKLIYEKVLSILSSYEEN